MPTVCRENLQLVSTIAVSNKWKIHSMDVKSAFLQGFPIERVVLVIPLLEANTSNLWQLRKTVYGLNDASRSWYLKAWDEIEKNGAVKSTFDNALFFWRPRKKLEDLICFHVDDFFVAGSQQDHNTVIDHLRAQFQLSKEHYTQALNTHRLMMRKLLFIKQNTLPKWNLSVSPTCPRIVPWMLWRYDSLKVL